MQIRCFSSILSYFLTSRLASKDCVSFERFSFGEAIFSKQLRCFPELCLEAKVMNQRSHFSGMDIVGLAEQMSYKHTLFSPKYYGKNQPV